MRKLRSLFRSREEAEVLVIRTRGPFLRRDGWIGEMIVPGKTLRTPPQRSQAEASLLLRRMVAKWADTFLND